MTTKRLEEPAIISLKLPPRHEAKNLLHNAQRKLLFQHRMTFETEGSDHERCFLVTITTTFGRDVLPRIIDDVNTLKDGSVELAGRGTARSKKSAEFLAVLDVIALLQECGINVKNPPDIKAQHEAVAKERFNDKVSNAQMLLELLDVSRPRFEVLRSGGTWKGSVTMFLNDGTAVVAEGKAGRTKTEAEGKAIIAMAGEPIAEFIGRDTIDRHKALIEASPSGHVAPLRVHPLPFEVLDCLEEALGTTKDHNLRMQRHVLAKEDFDKKFREKQTDSDFRRTSIEDLTPNRELIHRTLINEENTRVRLALENPNGKQAKMKSIRDALPITKIRQDLIEMLRDQQVVVVSGGTGSGKSTQCPQYILEDAILNRKGADTKIIVTQPRRIAAISVADRVADERVENIGISVGYTVRFQRKEPRKVGGTIEFVTTGVLLRRLMNDPSLSGVSHVMIDEVHERDINTDFLIILLRDLLVKRPDLRIVLMSATLDAKSFGDYFSQGADGPLVPVLSVPTQPRYPVETIYLEDLADDFAKDSEAINIPSELQELSRSLLQYHDKQLEIELEEAIDEQTSAKEIERISRAEDEGKMLNIDNFESESVSENEDNFKLRRSRVEILSTAVKMSMRNFAGSDSSVPTQTTQVLNSSNDVNNAIVRLVAGIAQYLSQMETQNGSILCFLPGWDEIKAATAILENLDDRQLNRKLIILPLHSSIPQEDQQRVFIPAQDGTIKVILATNIAESSVTIDDVLAVVDSGLVRELNWDAESAMSRMETVPTSKASVTQRLGRAGRVAPGKCYRLYSRGAMEAMAERPTPEIQRTALEATCLQTCSMTSDGVQTFLRRALDPPPEDAVSFAMDRLIKLGAIVNNTEKNQEVLSPLGRCLSRLPLDPATGRMLMMGVVMKCLDPVLTAAACFSSRNIFYSPLGKREEARNIRQSFCINSDVMTMVRAYDEFWDIVNNQGWNTAKQWAFENFVSITAMVSIQSVRLQLLQELNKIGMIPNRDLERIGYKKKALRFDASLNQNSDNELLYSAVWATSVPNNLGARRQIGSFGTLRTRMEDHTGLHPSSVTFHRKPPTNGRRKLPSWYFYREMVLSSQVFLRDCTAITPEQMMLFGGYSLIDSTNKEYYYSSKEALLDDWILAKSSCHDTIELLINSRNEINAALEYKVMHPKDPLPNTSQSIIESVCDMFDILDNKRGT